MESNDVTKQAAFIATVAVLGAFVVVLEHHIETYYEPTGVRVDGSFGGEGARWLAFCMGNEQQLYEDSRLRRQEFDTLLTILEGNGWLKSTRHIAAAEKLLSFLYLCGNGSSYRNLKWRCGHSIETVGRNFHEVLQALLKLYPILIQDPVYEDIPSAIRDNKKRWPYFVDCVGAIDGSHFFAHVTDERQGKFRNHYGDLTQNVLAVVDFNMNFTYLLAGWEGTAHDMRVYSDALMEKGLPTRAGKYYVADAGYSNNDNLLVPYKKVRYHLREISKAGLKPKDKYELFNFRHSSLRNVVERTFGVFKRRWRIFDRAHQFEFETQRSLIYALAVVHNFINKFRRVDEDFESLGPYDRERFDDEYSEWKSRQNPTNLNPSSAPGDKRKMDVRREEIADLMWEDYQKAVGGLE